MFNANNLLILLKTRPFAPFRFVVKDGGTMEVNCREFVLPGRQFAVVGLLDPRVSGALIDGWTTLWYAQVSRVEPLGAGARPFSFPSASAESATPSSA